MALDPNYITTSDVDTYYVDKDTGLPLSFGKITYYAQDQSTPKPVYQFSGTPANPTYTALPNPLYLSSVGTIQDALGNNIVPYYKITNSDGALELYYITVDSQDGVRQLTRYPWPNYISQDQNTTDVINFIPNGQFLSHNDGDAQAVEQKTEDGDVYDVSHIAQGGWDMYISDGFTGVYTATFSRALTAVAGLKDFPRYILNFSCTTADVEPVRDIRCIFPNVNQFQSSSATVGDQYFTFTFACEATASFNVEVYLIKYFGSGGSPSSTVETLLQTIQVSPGYVYHNVQFQPGSNASYTVGTNGDDYVALAFRPANQTFTFRVTDCGLYAGRQDFSAFPEMTNAQMLSEGVAGWMPVPDPDGFDLYLPLVLTPKGVTFDDADIGKVRPSVTTDTTAISTVTNELLCNGDSYEYSGYSPLGIPYERLGAKLFDATLNQFLFGTGVNFVQSYINSGATSQIVLCTNKAGSQTAPANGGTSPGFSYGTVAAGATSIGYKAYSNSTGVVTAISTFTGATNGNADFDAGTSGIAFTILRNNSLTGIYKAVQFTALTAAVLGNGAGAGKYFTFSNTTTDYYMWFRTATETDPAPGGTGIQVDLPITMGVADVAKVIANVLSRYQVNTITTVAGAGIAAGSFFNFYANGVTYSVWYRLNNAGTAPPTNPIPVDIDGTETAAQIATKTITAINKFKFAVPDLRGMTLRGVDTSPTPIWDLGIANRFSTIGSTVTYPGTLELDEIYTHDHAGSQADIYSTPVGGVNNRVAEGQNLPGGSGLFDLVMVANGGSESRPVNMYVNYWIKY